MARRRGALAAVARECDGALLPLTPGAERFGKDIVQFKAGTV
jgi:hypothetical protein